MVKVGVHEAKTRLSELLRRVSGGEEILIMRGREPIARLLQANPRADRRLGIDRGKVVIGKNFDAPLPETVIRGFER